MFNYFIWNGVNSLDERILCSNPDVTIPQRDAEKLTIPGRSGFLTVDNEAYQPIVKTLECRLTDNSRIDNIAKWLDGGGKIIFSAEPDKYYRAVVNRAIPIRYMLERYRAFAISFDCQPFKYSVNYENDFLSLTQSNFTFYGKGTFQAEPIITVYGSGNISLNINGKVINLTGVSGKITINSEIMDAYRDNMNQNMNMVGDFPLLNANNEVNNIAWAGNVSKVEIIPNWRWL